MDNLPLVGASEGTPRHSDPDIVASPQQRWNWPIKPSTDWISQLALPTVVALAVLSVDEGEVILLELVEDVASKLWLATILRRQGVETKGAARRFGCP